MTDNNNDRSNSTPAANDDQEMLPLMQRILDNPFLLLVLGVSIPAVFYLIWGIIEITQIPIAD